VEDRAEIRRRHKSEGLAIKAIARQVGPRIRPLAGHMSPTTD